MKFDESIHMSIQKIYNDLQLLKNGYFYERDTVPGNPSYQTLATRMEQNLSIIKKVIKEVEKE